MEKLIEVNHSLFQKNTSRRSWKCWISDLLYYFSEPAMEMANLKRQANIHQARSPGSRLTTEEIQQLSSFMLDVQELDMRRAYFENRPIEQTFQGLAIPLVDWVLTRDSQIKTVVNIGAHYGYCDHVWAQRHPTTAFISVDFAPNLRLFNQAFIRDNLDFQTGYALDLLEAGALHPDVVMMSSTATVIKNCEVKRYLENVVKIDAYMIFNEPLYNLPGGAVIDPADISIDESVPAYQYKMPDGSAGPLCYSHNYKGLMEAAGMNILYYRVFRPSFTDLRMVQVIGKKRQTNEGIGV